jgi:hypothetical protein
MARQALRCRIAPYLESRRRRSAAPLAHPHRALRLGRPPGTVRRVEHQDEPLHVARFGDRAIPPSSPSWANLVPEFRWMPSTASGRWSGRGSAAVTVLVPGAGRSLLCVHGR